MMTLRMKHVYTLKGAMIAPRYFAALKKAAEGHFEGLTVELVGADGEVRFQSDSGQSIGTETSEGQNLAAWYQGWLCGYFVSNRPDMSEVTECNHD